MKKGLKIALCALGSLAIISGAVVGLDYIDNDDLSVSGTLHEGSGEYDWVKHEVYIAADSGKQSTKYYTHCKGDYIYNIDYKCKYLSQHFSYDANFSIFDDFDVMFVVYSFDNTRRIETPVERMHTPVGGDTISLDEEGTFNKSYYIKEIWIRTVD